MESVQKSVYKLLYFLDFWNYFFTFGYISSTAWSNVKLRFVQLKVLCIVIFVCVHNYLILFSILAHVTKMYFIGTVIFESVKYTFNSAGNLDPNYRRAL